jgi:predicted small metal-binding protein
VYAQEWNGSDTYGKRRLTMTLHICRDLGLDCSFQATGTTDNKIMREFIDHAASAHRMDVLSADVIFKVQKSIKK